jgi:hypothetical protein
MRIPIDCVDRLDGKSRKMTHKQRIIDLQNSRDARAKYGQASGSKARLRLKFLMPGHGRNVGVGLSVFRKLLLDENWNWTWWTFE